MASHFCRICGKPLTDPHSIENGMGDICRLKIKMKDMGRTSLFPRAQYDHYEHSGVICIEDHDNGRTVTNDMDNVLEDLRKAGYDIAGKKIMYRDTSGIWDEVFIISVDAFIVYEIQSIGLRDRAQAIEKLKNMYLLTNNKK